MRVLKALESKRFLPSFSILVGEFDAKDDVNEGSISGFF